MINHIFPLLLSCNPFLELRHLLPADYYLFGRFHRQCEQEAAVGVVLGIVNELALHNELSVGSIEDVVRQALLHVVHALVNGVFRLLGDGEYEVFLCIETADVLARQRYHLVVPIGDEAHAGDY